MFVAELINELKRLPQDSIILIGSAGLCKLFNIKDVHYSFNGSNEFVIEPMPAE